MSAQRKKPSVLIGPVCDDPCESVSAVNSAFMKGLSEQYAFISQVSNRKYGTERRAALNMTNIFYLFEHFTSWLRLLAKHKPDIVHYSLNSVWAMEKGLFFLKVARAFDAAVIGHLHGGGFLDFWSRLPSWRRRYALAALRGLDGLVVSSESWRQAVATHVGLHVDRLFVVSNPIEPGFEDAALQFPIERPDATVLSLGVMSRQKGVFDLLAAAAAARQPRSFRLTIAGPEREPNIRNAVQQFVAQRSLADTIEIKGAVGETQKLDLFRQASIFVLPSYFENFPLVVLEAAAAGHAIITTPVGAVPEFFEHGVSALFVEPGNTRQIAQAMVTLIEQPKERMRLGQAAREVFRSRLARARIMASLDRVYQQALRCRHHREGAFTVPRSNTDRVQTSRFDLDENVPLRVAGCETPVTPKQSLPK
jgi:glycosyltransferase involved in cell wall biosynthesis